jgi:phosphomevalonate kinase
MRAPGKLVLSGAYAVLEGAPALVTAVDRYVVADSSAVASFTTPEFAAARPDQTQPYFDANTLRDQGQKLGLGSSAAILVACLGVLYADEHPGEPLQAIRQYVFEQAEGAHRRAQGGGSGVDVAASSFGGHLLAQRDASGALLVTPVSLPKALVLGVWASGEPASTSQLLRTVFDLKRKDPSRFDLKLQAQARAAEAFAAAVRQGSAKELLSALCAQQLALDELGQAAGAPIVVDAVRQLHQAAREEGGCVLPSGAGGGDVSLYAGLAPPSAELLALARRLGQKPLDLRVGAEGLSPVEFPPTPEQNT